MKTIKATEAQELGVYKDTNHIINSPESLAKILGVNYTPDGENSMILDHVVTKWDNLIETEDGFWIPEVEFSLLKETPMKEIVGFGYINGRQHHMGFAATKGMSSVAYSPGYTFWVEYN